MSLTVEAAHELDKAISSESLPGSPRITPVRTAKRQATNVLSSTRRHSFSGAGLDKALSRELTNLVRCAVPQSASLVKVESTTTISVVSSPPPQASDSGVTASRSSSKQQQALDENVPSQQQQVGAPKAQHLYGSTSSTGSDRGSKQGMIPLQPRQPQSFTTTSTTYLAKNASFQHPHHQQQHPTVPHPLAFHSAGSLHIHPYGNPYSPITYDFPLVYDSQTPSPYHSRYSSFASDYPHHPPSPHSYPPSEYSPAYDNGTNSPTAQWSIQNPFSPSPYESTYGHYPPMFDDHHPYRPDSRRTSFEYFPTSPPGALSPAAAATFAAQGWTQVTPPNGQHPGDAQVGNTLVMDQLEAGTVLRRLGTTKFFDTQKGFGFILDDNMLDIGGRDIFVHYTALLMKSGFRCLSPMEPVEYDLVKASGGGYQALNVSGVGGKPLKGLTESQLNLHTKAIEEGIVQKRSGHKRKSTFGAGLRTSSQTDLGLGGEKKTLTTSVPAVDLIPASVEVKLPKGRLSTGSDEKGQFECSIDSD